MSDIMQSVGPDPTDSYELAAHSRSVGQSPELRIMEAMLRDALDLTAKLHSDPRVTTMRDQTGGPRYRICVEAEAWLLGSLNCEELYSIENVCAHLGTDVSCLQAAVRARAIPRQNRTMALNVTRVAALTATRYSRRAT